MERSTRGSGPILPERGREGLHCPPPPPREHCNTRWRYGLEKSKRRFGDEAQRDWTLSGRTRLEVPAA